MITANRNDPRGSGLYLTFDSPNDFLATLEGRENPCTAIFHPRDFPTNTVDPSGLQPPDWVQDYSRVMSKHYPREQSSEWVNAYGRAMSEPAKLPIPVPPQMNVTTPLANVIAWYNYSTKLTAWEWTSGRSYQMYSGWWTNLFTLLGTKGGCGEWQDAIGNKMAKMDPKFRKGLEFANIDATADWYSSMSNGQHHAIVVAPSEAFDPVNAYVLDPWITGDGGVYAYAQWLREINSNGRLIKPVIPTGKAKTSGWWEPE